MSDTDDVQVAQQWWDDRERELERRAKAVQRAGELAAALGEQELISSTDELIVVARFLLDG